MRLIAKVSGTKCIVFLDSSVFEPEHEPQHKHEGNHEHDHEGSHEQDHTGLLRSDLADFFV